MFFKSKIPLYHDIKKKIVFIPNPNKQQQQQKHSVYDEPTQKCDIKIIILFFLEKKT